MYPHLKTYILDKSWRRWIQIFYFYFLKEIDLIHPYFLHGYQESYNQQMEYNFSSCSCV